MSTRHKRTQDLTLLSTYLDHALKEPEEKKLEVRLAQEPELRERLENLRRTKHLLRFLPRLKAPHNFTLTPEMVTVRKPRQPIFTTLRYATAIAAILLVVLFSVEGITNLPKAATADESAILQEAETNDTKDAPEPLIFWGGPQASDAEGVGGGMVGGNSESADYVSEEMVMGTDPESPEVEESINIEEVPLEEIPPVDAMPKVTDGSHETSRSFGTNEDDDFILGLNTDEGGQIINQSVPTETNLQERAVKINPLRWIEIGLAVIFVGGGIAILFLRKRAR